MWTADGQRKIAAIGVKIAGGVTYHGFAINVNPDLTMFDGIVPCGIRDRETSPVWSCAGGYDPLPVPPAMDDVANVRERWLFINFRRLFHCN